MVPDIVLFFGIGLLIWGFISLLAGAIRPKLTSPSAVMSLGLMALGLFFCCAWAPLLFIAFGLFFTDRVFLLQSFARRRKAEQERKGD